VEARNGALRDATEDLDERGRRDDDGFSVRAAGAALAVAGRRPFEQLRAEHEERRTVLEREGSVGQLGERGFVEAVPARGRIDALVVELRVDRVRAHRSGMELSPGRAEADVVLAPAQRARPMTGGKGGRLVEEEELGELARLQERAPMPALEREPAGDPALPVEAAPDAARVVVQAAAVAVDEAARRVGDQLAERRDAVPERYELVGLANAPQRGSW
jgi:hypothetical protein